MSNHAQDRAAQEKLSAEVFARLHEQDIEQFYAQYQLWVLRRRVPLLEKQIETLREHIAENQQRLEALRPSALAQAVLVRLQSSGVSNIDLLDLMLERGEDWLDRVMQRLDYCEQVEDFIQGDYTQWCVRALEGAYDWIDSLLGSVDEEKSSQEDNAGEIVLTEELLLQKLSQDDEEAMRAVTLAPSPSQPEETQMDEQPTPGEEAAGAPDVEQPSMSVQAAKDETAQALATNEAPGRAENEEDITPPELLGWKDLEDLEAPLAAPVPWYSVNVTETGASSPGAETTEASSLTDWITVLQADNEVREESTTEIQSSEDQPVLAADGLTVHAAPPTPETDTETEQANSVPDEQTLVASEPETEGQSEEEPAVIPGEPAPEESTEAETGDDISLSDAPEFAEINETEENAPQSEEADEIELDTTTPPETVASALSESREESDQGVAQASALAPQAEEENKLEEASAFSEAAPAVQAREQIEVAEEDESNPSPASADQEEEAEEAVRAGEAQVDRQDLDTSPEEMETSTSPAIIEQDEQTHQEEPGQQTAPGTSEPETAETPEEAEIDEEAPDLASAGEIIEPVEESGSAEAPEPVAQEQVESATLSAGDDSAPTSAGDASGESRERANEQAEHVSLSADEPVLPQSPVELSAQSELAAADSGDEFSAAQSHSQQALTAEQSADQATGGENELESAALLNDVLSIEGEQAEQMPWYEYLNLEETAQENAQNELTALHTSAAAGVNQATPPESDALPEARSRTGHAASSIHEPADHARITEEAPSEPQVTTDAPEPRQVESADEIEGWQTWQSQDADEATLPMALKDIHATHAPAQKEAEPETTSEDQGSDIPQEEPVSAVNTEFAAKSESSQAASKLDSASEAVGADASEKDQAEAPSKTGPGGEEAGEESQQSITAEEARIEELTNAPTMEMNALLVPQEEKAADASTATISHSRADLPAEHEKSTQPTGSATANNAQPARLTQPPNAETPAKKVGFWRRLFGFGRRKKSK